MPFEKIMNSIYEIWSKIMPNRAIACAFNLEYLLTGGRDLRASPRSRSSCSTTGCPAAGAGATARDGCNVTTACFGTGLQSQPVEGQERVSPDPDQRVSRSSRIRLGPGKWRGGAGVRKTSTLGEADRTVISYICDRERAIVWGIEGGLPSMPHGLSLQARRIGHGGVARLGVLRRAARERATSFQPPHRAAAAATAIRWSATRCWCARMSRTTTSPSSARAQGLRRGAARRSTRIWPNTRSIEAATERERAHIRAHRRALAAERPERGRRGATRPANSTAWTLCASMASFSTGARARCLSAPPRSSARCSKSAPLAHWRGLSGARRQFRWQPRPISAPLPGTFYRKPAPDKPPFKADGDTVAEGDTIGLIEVMKSFNEVKAERSRQDRPLPDRQRGGGDGRSADRRDRRLRRSNRP